MCVKNISVKKRVSEMFVK